MYFWAKTTETRDPGVSVYDHMIDVGSVAQKLAELFPHLFKRFNLDSSITSALVALHDIGKISPGFQMKCEKWVVENDLIQLVKNHSWNSAEKDHGKTSHAMLQSFLLNRGFDGESSTYLSAAIGAHHGRLNRPNERGFCPPGVIIENQSGIDWERERTQFAEEVWKYFLKDNESNSFSITDESPELWWIAGLTTVADWIGSDERFFCPSKRTAPFDSLSIADQVLKAIGFKARKVIPGLTFHDLFCDTNAPEKVWVPNDVQKSAFENIRGPGVYVIEAPTGMGKTEAALWAAYELLISNKVTGIYFALPTQATSNRIHLRVSDFLNRIFKENVVGRLAHANSWLVDQEILIKPAKTGERANPEEDARTSRDWFASAKRALLFPFGVGTVDQALLGIVAAKHFFVRHFALAGKVVILDEVHSYDLYTGTLIDKLITTLEGLGCTVIILSATLSKKRLQQIIPEIELIDDKEYLHYPLITGRSEQEPIEPVQMTQPESRTIEIEFISKDGAGKLAISAAQQGGSVLWISNTVDAAQQYYQSLLQVVSEKFPIGLLHSRFPFWRREQLEIEWMERFGKNSATRCGSILVSTQIVEQSVDLDADLLISELAPTDMLIQRLGRLWRHDREGRPVNNPKLYIIEEEKSLEELRKSDAANIKKIFGNKAHVYDPYILLRSLEVWKSKQVVLIPAQVRELIETTYHENENEPGEWIKLHDEQIGGEFAKRMTAIRNSNIWQVSLEDNEEVQTRLNEISTVSLILCLSVSDNEIVFIDKTRAPISTNDYKLSTAQKIHKNIVKVPKYCFQSFVPAIDLSLYVREQFAVGIIGESGKIKVIGLKSGFNLSYSDLLGLVIEK